MDTADPASTWEIRSRVGLVLQDPDDQIVGTVVEEDVAFGPEDLGPG
jgi:energy-coupling factor transport system ATP-binding protein